MMAGRLKKKKSHLRSNIVLAGSFNHEMLKVLVKTVTDIEVFHIQTLIESKHKHKVCSNSIESTESFSFFLENRETKYPKAIPYKKRV